MHAHLPTHAHHMRTHVFFAVLDLFLSAAQPERLSVALVQQHATWQQHRAAGQGAAEPAGGADGDCMDLVESVAPEFGAQVRRVVMRPEEARGPVLARNLSRGLYAGEHYALSIDRSAPAPLVILCTCS